MSVLLSLSQMLSRKWHQPQGKHSTTNMRTYASVPVLEGSKRLPMFTWKKSGEETFLLYLMRHTPCPLPWNQWHPHRQLPHCQQPLQKWMMGMTWRKINMFSWFWVQTVWNDFDEKFAGARCISLSSTSGKILSNTWDPQSSLGWRDVEHSLFWEWSGVKRSRY